MLSVKDSVIWTEGIQSIAAGRKTVINITIWLSCHSQSETEFTFRGLVSETGFNSAALLCNWASPFQWSVSLHLNLADMVTQCDCWPNTYRYFHCYGIITQRLLLKI